MWLSSYLLALHRSILWFVSNKFSLHTNSGLTWIDYVEMNLNAFTPTALLLATRRLQSSASWTSVKPVARFRLSWPSWICRVAGRSPLFVCRGVGACECEHVAVRWPQRRGLVCQTICDAPPKSSVTQTQTRKWPMSNQQLPQDTPKVQSFNLINSASFFKFWRRQWNL